MPAHKSRSVSSLNREHLEEPSWDFQRERCRMTRSALAGHVVTFRRPAITRRLPQYADAFGGVLDGPIRLIRLSKEPGRP